jgi:SlyX protein
MENNELDSRLTQVEIKLAYLEDFLNKLQNIAVEQGNYIDALVKESKTLHNKVQEIVENQEGDIPNIRPPHY